MLIQKTTETTPLNASVVNVKNNSTTDAYSCNIANTLFQKKGTILYNNPSGTNNDVTLNDSVENYSQIIIMYKNIVNLANSVMITGNNVSIEFSTAYKEASTTTFYVVGCKGTISNNIITLSDFYTATNGVINDTINKYIYITKVIGIK